MGARSVEAVAEEDDLAAEAAHGVDLDRGGRGGHDDDGADAHAGGREGHALGMVAGRGADDAALPLLGREMRHAIVRAADLEGEDRLQVLALEQYLGAEARGEALHGFERGLFGHFIDRRGQDLADIVMHGAAPGMPRWTPADRKCQRPDAS